MGAMIIKPAPKAEDPYLWLENVLGEKALKWVKEKNRASVSALESVPGFRESESTMLSILDSDQKIPYASKRGNFLYNFWKDKDHPRGILRRTSVEEYKKKKPAWETVLDVDSLAAAENENWVYKGSQYLHPAYDRALVNLSRGGSDAMVVREFDLVKKQFLKDGFYLPEAKSMIQWVDRDTVFVGTDFGKGTLTESGYPAIVKIWKRNTPLEKAETLHHGDRKSVYVYGARLRDSQGYFDILAEAKTFFTHVNYHLKDGKLHKLNIPDDADIVGYFRNQLIIMLKSDLQTGRKNFLQGSVIIGKTNSILSEDPEFTTLMEPGERLSISDVSTTQNQILITVLDNVVSRLYRFSMEKNGGWIKSEVPVKDNGTLSVYSTEDASDDYFVIFENFLTPDSLYRISGETGEALLLKQLPAWFDSAPLATHQFEAVSRDGTRIPYFVIHRKDMKRDGSNPTLLYGYGGFMISMKPFYSGEVGSQWLAKGGVYVLSNIRGGGEFGPQWHQAALKKNRKKSFEDFIAIAEDLIRRKITSPEKLGIKGGSNGGLLVGAVFVMRPELFNAVVCQVPLLDMKRYTKLLAGASWAAEYGNPDKPDMWEYIKTYSPYHNVRKDVDYPQVFFLTSTKDDRVHPGHARKMVAKMTAQGHSVFYYENTEGGHAGSANNQQRAYMSALEYAYFYKKLMGK